MLYHSKQAHNSLKLEGRRFGKLVVISRVWSLNWNSLWACQCDCWKVKNMTSCNLKHSNSCGCVRKHWLYYSAIHWIWNNMKYRCLNRNNKQFNNYGGRWISVCNEWLDFENFHFDMHQTYIKGLQLDRINNNWNYCKENCRWVTAKENCNNKSNNRLITFWWKIRTISERAKEFNLSYIDIYYRLKKHISIDTPKKYFKNNKNK